MAVNITIKEINIESHIITVLTKVNDAKGLGESKDIKIKGIAIIKADIVIIVAVIENENFSMATMDKVGFVNNREIKIGKGTFENSEINSSTAIEGYDGKGFFLSRAKVVVAIIIIKGIKVYVSKTAVD